MKYLFLGITIALIGLVSTLSLGVQSMAQPINMTIDDAITSATTEGISFKIQLKKQSNDLLADGGYYQEVKSISGFTNSSNICPSASGCEFVLTKGQMSPKPIGFDSYAFQGKLKITTPIDEQSSRSKFYEVNSDLKMFKEKINGSKTIRFFQGFLRLEPGEMDYNITKALLFYENEKKLVLSIEARKISSANGDITGEDIQRDADIAADKITSDANQALKKIKKLLK